MSSMYQTPGVYLENIFPAPPPDLRTAVPVFLGYTSQWPAEQPGPLELAGARMLTLWPQFALKFGEPRLDAYLGYAVRGFFANGGQMCYVARLDESLDPEVALAEGLKSIEALETVDLVCAPEIARRAPGTALLPDRDAILRMQKAVLEHCDRLGTRFAILDARPSWWDTEPGDAVQKVRDERAVLNGTNGALYYPWLVTSAFNPAADTVNLAPAAEPTVQAPAADPAAGNPAAEPTPLAPAPVPAAPGAGTTAQAASRQVSVPPCGHVAGIYARTDQRTGVHKAPANEELLDLVDLRDNLTDARQGLLNPEGVNCIRSFPGRGMRVWGARTLSREPAWQYVSVRRLFITAARWMELNMTGTSFEPNGLRLWARVTRELTGYFTSLYRRGALQGRTPQEAFYIKCDAENNPPEVRDAGMIVAEIGLAPAQPHEFVVVRIVHGASGVQILGPGQP